MFIEEETTKASAPQLGTWVKRWALRVAVMVSGSVLLAIAGPFGTYRAGDFFERVFYWVVVICVSLAVALGVKALVGRVLKNCSLIAQEVTLVLLMTAIFPFFLMFWSEVAFPGQPRKPAEFALFFFEVLAICVVLSLIRNWFRATIAKPGELLAADAQPRIIRRFDEDFTGEILYLTVDGHMVSVVTSQGTFELRMRFADAVEEVSELHGFCTHRSYWVNPAAICHVVTRNGRPVVIMKDQNEVPVSRKYQKNVENAGLI